MSLHRLARPSPNRVSLSLLPRDDRRSEGARTKLRNPGNATMQPPTGRQMHLRLGGRSPVVWIERTNSAETCIDAGLHAVSTVVRGCGIRAEQAGRRSAACLFSRLLLRRS